MATIWSTFLHFYKMHVDWIFYFFCNKNMHKLCYKLAESEVKSTIWDSLKRMKRRKEMNIWMNMNICTFHIHSAHFQPHLKNRWWHQWRHNKYLYKYLCFITTLCTILWLESLSKYVLNKRDFKGPKEENVHKKWLKTDQTWFVDHLECWTNDKLLFMISLILHTSLDICQIGSSNPQNNNTNLNEQNICKWYSYTAIWHTFFCVYVLIGPIPQDLQCSSRCTGAELRVCLSVHRSP